MSNYEVERASKILFVNVFLFFMLWLSALNLLPLLDGIVLVLFISMGVYGYLGGGINSSVFLVSSIAALFISCYFFDILPKLLGVLFVSKTFTHLTFLVALAVVSWGLLRFILLRIMDQHHSLNKWTTKNKITGGFVGTLNGLMVVYLFVAVVQYTGAFLPFFQKTIQHSYLIPIVNYVGEQTHVSQTIMNSSIGEKLQKLQATKNKESQR